jgi:hypothetical protein
MVAENGSRLVPALQGFDGLHFFRAHATKKAQNQRDQDGLRQLVGQARRQDIRDQLDNRHLRMVEPRGVEPLTFSLRTRRSTN